MEVSFIHGVDIVPLLMLMVVLGTGCNTGNAGCRFFGVKIGKAESMVKVGYGEVDRY